jgi:hypothetical protein
MAEPTGERPKLKRPAVGRRASENMPSWPTYTGVSQLVGTSPTGRVTVYVDAALGPPGLQNALDDADRIVATNDALFGTTGGPVSVIVFALGSETDGTGGADHMGCDYTTGAAIEICASFGNSARVSALFEAMLSECSMGGNLCGVSTGEALSRWCAAVISSNALSDFATAPTWAQSGMPDFVNQTEPNDRNAVSIGCGMAFLSWLMSRGNQLNMIAPAMVSLGVSGTLAQLYASLTGDAASNAWPAFIAAIQRLPGGVATDDPFGTASRPAQLTQLDAATIELATKIFSSILADVVAGKPAQHTVANVRTMMILANTRSGVTPVHPSVPLQGTGGDHQTARHVGGAVAHATRSHRIVPVGRGPLERSSAVMVPLGHGVTVLLNDYLLYRKLSYAILGDQIWHKQYQALGVAISADGLTILVERKVADVADQLHELAGAELSLREIGPILNAASGGDSTGAGTGRQSSGSFGCLVANAKGVVLGLSCDHVIGKLAGQSIGAPVWSPGKARGGTSNSKIGEFKLGSSVVLSSSSSNRVDGALIELESPLAHRQSIVGIPGAPTGVSRSISFGDTLKKSGAATGVTNGQFSYIVTMNVPYKSGQARFVDQIAIDGGGIVFADKGDSGAVVLDASNRVVGLLFSAAPQSFLGFANFIDDVETELGVTIV